LEVLRMLMNKPKTRNENIVVQEMSGELLIYDLQTNKAFCLNEISAIIYKLCDGKRNVAEIKRESNKQLKESVSEDFIWLALDGLKKENLLEESEQFPINFNGLSRRQIIKKIGFTSLIALPVVGSIVAPNAAMAQSDLCAGKNCNDGNLCTTDTCNRATGQCVHIAKICDDNDRCTRDFCDASTGNCIFEPISCPSGQTCNPATGVCS